MASSHKKLSRCQWCEGSEIYIRYHDEEWGVKVKDDQTLFAFLCLEGAQAGLSWITVLKRREAYYAAFHQFDIEKVACMTPEQVLQAMQEHGVIKHQGKCLSVVKNAQAVLALKKEGISFSDFLWQFAPVGKLPKKWAYSDIPTMSAESKAMSKALKKQGFTFVGETICYAFMQAVGMVNDHVDTCYRRTELLQQ
jgi:DNA-3-methyladenine glycosylase I